MIMKIIVPLEPQSRRRGCPAGIHPHCRRPETSCDPEFLRSGSLLHGRNSRQGFLLLDTYEFDSSEKKSMAFSGREIRLMPYEGMLLELND